MPAGSKTRGAPSGLKLRYTLEGFHQAITNISWSPDGRTLATAQRRPTITLWSGEKGEFLSEFETQSLEILRLAWSPDGALIAASSRSIIGVWNATTRLPVWRKAEKYTNHLAWSPSGKHFAAAESLGNQKEPDPLKQLIWGITGERGE